LHNPDWQLQSPTREARANFSDVSRFLGTIKEEIHNFRRMSSSPFGVKLAVGMGRSHHEQLLEVALVENVPVISITGGNPTPILREVIKTKTKSKTIVQVSTVRQAQKEEAILGETILVQWF
jgi:NADH:quinone reductase (non-electrogenic)